MVLFLCGKHEKQGLLYFFYSCVNREHLSSCALYCSEFHYTQNSITHTNTYFKEVYYMWNSIRTHKPHLKCMNVLWMCNEISKHSEMIRYDIQKYTYSYIITIEQYYFSLSCILIDIVMRHSMCNWYYESIVKNDTWYKEDNEMYFWNYFCGHYIQHNLGACSSEGWVKTKHFTPPEVIR